MEYEYRPSEKEKKKLEKIADRVVDVLSGITVTQKAFVLMMLVQSFQETSGIDIAAMLDGEKR